MFRRSGISPRSNRSRKKVGMPSGKSSNESKRRCRGLVLGSVGVVAACILYSIQSGVSYTVPSDLSMFTVSMETVADNTPAAGTGTATRKTQEAAPATATVIKAAVKKDDPDKDCIFRDSPIYRKVFVYPNPGEKGWEGDILTKQGRNLTAMQWPWIKIDETAKQEAQAHYDVESQNVQYTTELLVRELMINPKSCLRTYDPEEATLFYVPYLPSTEHHMGHRLKTDYSTSPYGKAIMEIIDNEQYDEWERLFGLTSKYWKRRKGSDHILVFSEPMHGLYHPRSKRGNFHFIHTQKQLKPPIVISVELSTSFVQEYPKCAAKNILVPYPNTHGDWFNGVYAEQAEKLLLESKIFTNSSLVALPAERQLASTDAATATTGTSTKQLTPPRPMAQYYSAGAHGTCTKLRKAMKADYQACAPSHKAVEQVLQRSHFSTAMRIATFCPCPGGDSPSAKRHFDSLIAGCIPIILSHDFVWPFTKEFDPSLTLDPDDFSIRMNANDFDEPLLDPETCEPLDPAKPGLQAALEAIPAAEIARLREGVAKAGQLYSWYSTTNNSNLPVNPLRDGVLPDGGTAHFVVRALAERARGQRWPACEEEMKQPHGPDPRQFKC